MKIDGGADTRAHGVGETRNLRANPSALTGASFEDSTRGSKRARSTRVASAIPVPVKEEAAEKTMTGRVHPWG